MQYLSSRLKALGFLACTYASLATESAQSASFEETLVDAFLNHCVLNLPNLEKVRAASRLFGWTRLSQDAAILLGPISPDAVFEGWMVGEKASRYLIGISTGSMGPQPGAICTVASPELKQTDLLISLQKKLSLKFLNDEREAGQRYRAWTTTANDHSLLIILTTLQDENTVGATLAAAVKLR